MLLKVAMGSDYTCGGISNFVFSGTFPYLISTIITIVQIAVPILLIIFGMLDLGKAVIAAKEDEIKKGQQTFIKRLIAGAIVFFVILVVKTIVRFVSNGSQSVMQCFNCFIYAQDEDSGCNLAN